MKDLKVKNPAQDPKKIKLLKDYDRFKKDDVIVHHGAIAAVWAKRGICQILGDGPQDKECCASVK